MKYILAYVLEATRGGPTREKILKILMKKPGNVNQLSVKMKMDYKTIQHHLKVLENNRIIGVVKKGSYGAMYYIYDEIKKLLEEMGKN